MSSNPLKTFIEENVEDTVNNNLVKSSPESIMSGAFLWAGIITLITFFVGYLFVYLYNSGIISYSMLFGLFVASFLISLLLLIYIASSATKESYNKLAILAILFGVFEGVGLSSILIHYSIISVMNAFVGAGAMLVIMGIIGYKTKTDLSDMWNMYLGGLLGLIVLSLSNVLFFHSSKFDLILTIGGLIIFMGLVVYDVQLLKKAAKSGDKRVEIMFGISLFLDFINIFIELLKLMGKRKG